KFATLTVLILLSIPLGGTTFAQSSISFDLKDVNGKRYSISDFGDAKALVVAFVGTECPLVSLYAKRLQKLADRFQSDGVSFIAINSNRQDSLSELQAFVRDHSIEFPLLKDPGNRVADHFGATRTPEVFLLNKAREIVYQGTIDDQFNYGVQQKSAKNHYLRDAIKQYLNNTPIDISKTDPIGCLIGRQLKTDNNSTVSFHNQISRIFQKRCIQCHREGELAPFALSDYDEVAGWASMIKEVIEDRRMPPWHAEAAPGHFKNDSRLTEQEKQLIFDWVDAGAPEGDPADAPAARQFAKDWQIGVPDQVIKMDSRPFKVPANGIVDYKYFVVDPGFKEDKWIQAAECRPGNRAVVHHIIVGVKGMGEFGRNRSQALESEWIAATAPGAPPMVLPQGYAKLVPAGSKLIFQMHYTPNGTRQFDLSEIGLVFAKPDEVKKKVITLMSHNDELRIPPGDDNYEIQSFKRIREDVELLAMFPHMHYRGKKFKFEFKTPGGDFETLLDVPYYDFNWQNSYELARHRQLPKGTRVRCTAVFDNSEKNLSNPDPTRTVYWGDQTWDEMMIGYFDVAVDAN
ncbi:MAG: redoxin domain-containing protein, partial [Planctomycetota bacterium]